MLIGIAFWYKVNFAGDVLLINPIIIFLSFKQW